MGDYESLEAWVLLFGLEDIKFFPGYVLRWHLENGDRVPIHALKRELQEEQWEALQRYYRELADAIGETKWKWRRAAEKYRAKLQDIRDRWREARANNRQGPATGVP